MNQLKINYAKGKPTPYGTPTVMAIDIDTDKIAEDVYVKLINNDIEVGMKKSGDTYINDSIKAYFDHHRDGRIFTTRFTKYENSTRCEGLKIADNSGLVCEGSTLLVQGRDDYQTLNAFANIDVDAYVDDDGVPHVYSMRGERSFSLENPVGDIAVMTPVCFYRITEDNLYTYVSWSDTRHAGFSPQPGALLPDGTIRPYMLFAKYCGSLDSNGKARSMSNKSIWNKSISYNGGLNKSLYRSNGESLKTHADDFYIKMMFMIKYATYNSQNVYKGCVGYDVSADIISVDDGYIVTKANADKFVLNSWVSVGTVSTDRNNKTSYDIIGSARIVSKDTLSDGNVSIKLDGTSNYNQAGKKMVSIPWGSGSCDNILGRDGSIEPTLYRAPFAIQGIECSLGAYEIVGNIIMDALAKDDSSLHEYVYLCDDTKYLSETITSNYKLVGELPVTTSEGWHYPDGFVDAYGLLLPTGTEATSTTGLGDGVYQNVASSKGLKEFLSVGNLWNGSFVGLWCVLGSYGLGSAGWGIVGRRSFIGRSRA